MTASPDTKDRWVSDPAITPTTVAWVMAVLGAVAILVGPITPWVLVVECVGMVVCLVASSVLAAIFFRE